MTRPLHIVIPGGSGQVGTMLARHLNAQGHRVTVLTRHKHTAPWEVIGWNGTSIGDWAATLEGADILINLSGRSVNCRYTDKNRAEIKESRTTTTQLLGRVLSQLARPPRLWMNASTATIYRHAMDRPMDEANGEIGGAWIHDSDFLRSIDYLIAHEELDGAVNLAAPNPVPNRVFMQALRRAVGAATGLPSTRLMLELSAWFLRTQTELILKSRRVIPGRLLRSGFNFQFPDWVGAARDLILRYRARKSK